eukprot:SAG11_NODE_16046_length_558_cov_1.132898_1_plen_110_part_10
MGLANARVIADLDYVRARYEWWLLQDYWTASQGILDAYYQPKFDNATMTALAALNAGVQLLVAQEGDNLPGLADDAPRLLRWIPSHRLSPPLCSLGCAHVKVWLCGSETI